MGLSSALSTALTGLNAAEATIDVVGNNIANSNTVGFKASDAVFATQFLQTQSLGSAPTLNTSGGTNPRQTGLGTKVAAITPDFTQGTIEISASPSDLAIQGDGFFIVQGSQGEQLYTRNGIFSTNSENELITVGGNRLLGFGVDDSFRLQTTELVPIEIPLGAKVVAQPTENVFLEGALSPNGELADTAEIIQSGILGDGSQLAPTAGPTVGISTQPADTYTATEGAANATALSQGFYRYKVVFVDASGNETTPSDDVVVEVTTAGGAEVDLAAIPDNLTYASRRVYRSEVQGSAVLTDPPPTYYQVADIASGGATTFNDTIDDVTLATNPALDDDVLSGNYSYYVTFYKAGQPDSRPSPLTTPVIVSNGRLELTNLPADPSGGVFDGIRIWRNTANDNQTFYEVDTVAFGETFIDNFSDTEIQTLGNEIDLDGPRITPGTLLTDVLLRDGSVYNQVFEEGTLTFQGEKGGRTLAAQEFEVTATTTVQDWMTFVEQALGIQKPPGPDPINIIPGDSSGSNIGGDIVNGRITFVGNNGVQNAIDIGLSGLQLSTSTGNQQVVLPFGSIQQAAGESAVTDFVAYDSLGSPLNVRVTMVLESRNSTSTTYRWFADSPNNQPTNGSSISVGTGLVTFDGEGNISEVSESTVSIERRDVSAASPLEFDLDFNQISGLAVQTSTLNASRQDGSAPGTLTSYIVGEDGTIRGVFSNGVSRDLGQLRLARFANPEGLEQLGENLYASGVNSGLAIEGSPGEQGIGSIVAGAVELSNTDIGANLIDLILATTQYRGNTRVITAAQQLFDELLNLRR